MIETQTRTPEQGENPAFSPAMSAQPDPHPEPDSVPDPRPGGTPPEQRSDAVRVVFLNHRGDPCGELVEALVRAGYQVQESTSIGETRELLPAPGAPEPQPQLPSVVLLNPLTPKPDGVEAEMLAQLSGPGNHGERPAVIVLVESLSLLRAAVKLAHPFHVRDFLLRPFSVDELIHRVDMAVQNRAEVQRLHRRNQDLEGQVSIDAKTGLLSERHFHNLLQVECHRAQRHGLPLSLLLVDVDDFKGVNDSTEYSFGDDVLRKVASHLKTNTRDSDYPARFGGDEFVVLLPHTTPKEAVQTALRIRERIAAEEVRRDPYRYCVTVSIGIGWYDGATVTSDPKDLLRQANKALHEAKRLGKDRVYLYPHEQTRAPDAADSPQVAPKQTDPKKASDQPPESDASDNSGASGGRGSTEDSKTEDRGGADRTDSAEGGAEA